MRKTIIIVSLFILFSSLLLSQSREEDRTLRVGIESDLTLTNPWNILHLFDSKMLRNIFEPLVTLDKKSTTIQPLLATSWQASRDNRIWLIKLRNGVKFHDGSMLTADDVIASVSLFKDFEALAEKVDDFTIRFTLLNPHSGFLHRLGLFKYGISPVRTVNLYKSLEQNGRLENFVPVSTGPFKYSRHVRGKEIVLESFSDYWQGSPWLEKLTYKVIPNNKERISALEKGEIDLIDVLLPTDFARIKQNLSLKILNIYGMNICYIAINTNRRPLNNKKVRQALSLAINKMKLTQMFYYGGYGVPTNKILSPAFWGIRARPSAVQYLPEQSKQLLKEAGYDGNLSLKLTYIPVARRYLPDPIGVAEEIKKQLANVGIQANIIAPKDISEFMSIINSGDFDLSLLGFTDTTGDPDYILSSLLSRGASNPLNYARWKNVQFEEKLIQARQIPLQDLKGKIRLYNEAQQILEQEVPWIPLFHTKIFVIHNQKVKGLILYPSGLISYHKVRFSD